MEIKVIIVEDNAEISAGLTYLINNSPDFTCVKVFKSAEDFLAQLADNKFDVVLMDINLPGMNGIECVNILKKKMPSIDIIMLTVYEDDENIFSALRSGAHGYLLKKTPPAQLIEGIRDVVNGGSPMSSQIARKVVQSYQAQKTKTEKLSDRELEIITLLSKGFRYKEIGEKIFISTETVRTHIRNIYEKLQVHSRTEALNKLFSNDTSL